MNLHIFHEIFTLSLFVLILALTHSNKGESLSGERSLNRTKRQYSNDHIRAWRRIYSFSTKLSKLAGNNELLRELIEMMTFNPDLEEPTRSYVYGYGQSRPYGYACYGCGYGYYGGYGYGTPAVIYYVPQQQSFVPNNDIYDFTSNLGNTVSNTELIVQLIQLIQQSIDYTSPTEESA